MNTNTALQTNQNLFMQAEPQPLKTRLYKSRDGWAAESMSETDANGQAWQISTHKSRNGVNCYAIQGQDKNGMFSYMMFGSKRLELAQQDGQCNENKVKAVHAAGLVKFAELMQAEPETIKPKYVLGVGQIIFTDGYSDQVERVIYEVISPGNFRTVTTDGKHLQQDDHVKPYTEKFGIGVYYNEGETMEAEQVKELVKNATEATAERNREANEKAQEAAILKAQNIEKGKEIINSIPSDVVAVIVAESRYDKSDLQSDYHAFETGERVYLSWSTHKRDIFAEMRKAAAKFEPTSVYSVAPIKPEGEEGKYWSAPDEHREKYSMGSGYYLGDSKYSGWIIKKEWAHPEHLEAYQVAAAEGRFLCGEVEQEEVKNYEAVQVEEGSVNIVDYSAKAFAVVGDTKPIKELLKSLGGRFNFRLTCGAGWIFPKTKLEEVTNALAA